MFTHTNKTLNLTTTIDPNAGFCFGVISAIKKAEEILEKDGRLYCLGEIVHNEEETERLQNKGLEIINYTRLDTIFKEKVLIRAHGEPPATYEKIMLNNNEIIDTSCKIILKIQEYLRQDYEDGKQIFIYGRHNHPEVIGLAGQTNNTAIIFEQLSELESIDLPKEITLYSQTTQSLEKYNEIINVLTEKGITVNKKDTICRQVANRQPQLKIFCRENDIILFIAGKNSSNGKVLYKTCKEANARVHLINFKDELSRDWFLPGQKVGITGATSTPQWLLQDIRNRLEKW